MSRPTGPANTAAFIASALADAIPSRPAPLTAQLDDEHATADPGYAQPRHALGRRVPAERQ